MLETFDIYFTVEDVWVDLLSYQGWDLAPQLQNKYSRNEKFGSSVYIQ